jgi:hypothetical protein
VNKNKGDTPDMAKYDVFLSHSEQDEQLIARIHDALSKLGLEVYVEEYESAYGEDIVNCVSDAIERSNYFLVVLTEKSIKSQWVNQEIGYAYALEKDIIPVRVGEIHHTGMVGNIKGIKAKSDDFESIISEILYHFAELEGKTKFYYECDECDDGYKWLLPDESEIKQWIKRREPYELECDCKYTIKLNPLTLEPVK